MVTQNCPEQEPTSNSGETQVTQLGRVPQLNTLTWLGVRGKADTQTAAGSMTR